MHKSRFVIRLNIAGMLLFLFGFQTIMSQGSNTLNDYGLPVFPGVTGFGLTTKGGQGGTIIKVTNLNMSGPGSLAEAIETHGPRIVVFEVGGVIDLQGSSITINRPEITIAGQTAPSPGISLIKGGIIIGTHDVIIQHIRIRAGEAGRAKNSGWDVDGMTTSDGAYNVIIDHCSSCWATDENLSASGSQFKGKTLQEWRLATSHQLTISNCIISEALSNSTHSKGEHSKGTLVHDNITEIALIGNLYAHNRDRNPLFKGGVQGVIINNVVYDPGIRIFTYGLAASEWGAREWVTGTMVAVGNYAKCGQSSRKGLSMAVFTGPCNAYFEDNIALDTDGNTLNQLQGDYIKISEIPFWPDGYIALPANQVKEYVLKNAGARPWDRDQIDARIIRDVTLGTGKIIDSEQEVGGYPAVEQTYAAFNPEEWNLTTLTKLNSDASIDSSKPLSFALYQNFPNPFNASTTIRFELPKKSHVSIKVYSILGQEAATLFDGTKDEGTYSVVWDASNFSDGVYIAVMKAGNKTSAKKMIYAK